MSQEATQHLRTQLKQQTACWDNRKGMGTLGVNKMQ